MTIESWLALGAAALLAVASGARIEALRGSGDRWNRVAWGARLAAALLLLASLLLATLRRGGWSAFDLQQIALSLALAVTGLHLALSWRPTERGGNPLADLAALAVLLITVVVVQPGAPPTDCIHHTAISQVQWIVFTLGSGGIVVAGSAGLLLALAAALAGRGWAFPRRADLHAQLQEPTLTGLIFLGAGLALNSGWSWWAMGTFTSGDPRELWMIVTWLVAAMSLLAWQLGNKAARWAAGLAVVAAAVTLFALLALPDLARLSGLGS